jgi:hypothetical protein
MAHQPVSPSTHPPSADPPSVETVQTDTVQNAMSAWDRLVVPDSITVQFIEHCGPTDCYDELKVKHPHAFPYIGELTPFTKSRNLSSLALLGNTLTDGLEAWTSVLKACIDSTTDLPQPTSEQLIEHALRLAQTPPDCFEGGNFQPRPDNQDAVFRFHPIAIDHMDIQHPHQRHDILLWIASFRLLGKAFNSESWKVPLNMEILVNEPSDTEIVLQVQHGSDTVPVTRKALNSLKNALDVNANKLSPFFQYKFAIIAVTDILGVDLLEYSMPQAQADFDQYNWDRAEIGRFDTYPKAPQPDQKHFDIVSQIYKQLKDQKEAEVAAAGFSGRSAFQSYITYKQKWKLWRDLMAVYRHMQPDAPLADVEATARFRLKLCGSRGEIEFKVQEDVGKFLKKRRTRINKEAAHAQAQAAVQQANNEAEQAHNAAQEAREQQERLQADADRLAAQRAQQVLENQRIRDREVRVSRRAAQAQEQKKVEEARKLAIQAAAKQKQKEQETKQKEQEAKEREASLQQQELDESSEEEVITNKRKRQSAKSAQAACLNDMSLLTPRGKAAKFGDAWFPPQLSATAHGYDKPGPKWAAESLKKLNLLKALHLRLKTRGEIGQTMSFVTLMEFLGDGDGGFSYGDRVFMYLVALMLKKKRFAPSACLDSFAFPNNSSELSSAPHSSALILMMLWLSCWHLLGNT